MRVRTAARILPQIGVAAAIWITWALVQGYDFDWDILNYHFYNGYALLHGKIFVNLQPAMLQSYFTPFIDAAFYILVHGLPPTAVVILIAAFQSLAFPILFRLSQRMLNKSAGTPYSMALPLALTVLGAAAPVSLWQAGSPRGDTITAVFVLGALLCAIEALQRNTGTAPPRLAALAGALVGLATGLKLTNAPFALGLIAAFLAARPYLHEATARRAWARAITACLLGMSALFMLTFGWWGLLIYLHVGNPVFPNFNQVFHSPYAAPVSYADPAFAVPGVIAKLLFPFTRSALDPAGLFDLRMAITLPLCVCALLAAQLRRSGSSPAHARMPAVALLAFVSVSYASWIVVFHVNRYLAALDMVAPLACAVAVSLIWPGRAAVWLVTAGLAAALPASAYRNRHLFWLPYDHRHGDEGGYFGVRFAHPPGLENGVVAMLGDRPTTFVIPFFPASITFVRLQGSLLYPVPGFDGLNENSTPATRQTVFGNAMGAAICRRLDNAKGGLFVLRLLPHDTPQDRAALAYFGLRYDPNGCTAVQNKSAMQIDLCPALRTPSPECRAQESAVSDQSLQWR